jgi:HEAT repeat protein
LVALGGPRVAARLISQLQDADAGVRWRAAYTLGQLKAKKAVEPLIAALEDQDPHVRGRTAEALGLIGSRSALRALREHANDNASAGHLGTVGEIAQAAQEEIEKKTRKE